MLTRDEFRQVKRLKCFLEEKAQHYQWLFISVMIEELTLDTLCLALREDFDGFDEYAEQLESGGLRGFLSSAQLEEIVENLRQQMSDYTNSELIAAVKYYWQNDAFIDLEVSSARPSNRN
jgi:hypothetical protein